MKPIRTLKGKYKCRKCEDYTKQRLLLTVKDYSIVKCKECLRIWWTCEIEDESDEEDE